MPQRFSVLSSILVLREPLVATLMLALSLFYTVYDLGLAVMALALVGCGRWCPPPTGEGQCPPQKKNRFLVSKERLLVHCGGYFTVQWTVLDSRCMTV